MEAVDRLVAWATARGVVLDGVAPRPLPGRGIGIVATRAIQTGEDVLSVPAALLRSLATTPRPVVRRLRGATVHAILAAALCLDAGPDLALWRAVLPAPDDVVACMPLCWPAALQALLPPAATALCHRQRLKFDADWCCVAAAYPGRVERDDFRYAWSLVNSRSFYHTTPATAARLPKDDHMVLQPVADLFNHAPEGCAVAFDRHGYSFTTTRAYEPGDEISICYGPHSNDFLLVEYGFILDMNPWDETCLDPFLCPAFSPSQRHRLEDAGFWERYMLDRNTACYRTQTALRMLCLAPKQWQAVLDGSRDEDADREAVDAQLLKVLKIYEKHIQVTMADVDRSQAGSDAMRNSLRSRWVQIKDLVVMTMSRLQS